MNTTVPTGEPKGYAVTAAELRRIADALDTLPPGDKPLHVQLYMFPSDGGADAVDAILFAIDGVRGDTKSVTDGWAHSATIYMPSLTVCVRATVPGPPDERDAEIERLRSELATLQASTDTTGNSFSREPDEVKPTSAVPNGVDGHSEFSGRASVPILCAAELPGGWMCHQPIYWNAAANAWWHQNNDKRFRHTATGPSVPPSDGGE